MNAITYDTLAGAKRLKAKGLAPDIAEAVAEELRSASETDMSAFATRADLRGDIAELKAELIKWMFGGFLTVVGLLVAILVKLH